MKGRSDIPLILGRLRPSEASTQVLGKSAAMREGTVQPSNFSKLRWAGSLSFLSDFTFNEVWSKLKFLGDGSIARHLFIYTHVQ